MVKRQKFGASLRKTFRAEWQMYSLLVLPVIFYIIFRYIPMVGNIIAFRRYYIGGSIFGDRWVGLRYFQSFITNEQFLRAVRNTIRLSGVYLLIRFPLTITFALLINEIRTSIIKRTVQTISYLPHFISAVVVAGMVREVVSLSGPINIVLRNIGLAPIHFLAQPNWFTTIYVVTGLWQNLGWGTILYLAAMTGVNPELYEAARIDGAGRFRQAMHVTIPGIMPTIVTLMVLDTGRILNASFDRVFLLYDPLTYEKADIISTYIYRIGLGTGNFSYATAVGFCETFIGMILIISVNKLSHRLTEESLW